jgi:hypothetical protein
MTDAISAADAKAKATSVKDAIEEMAERVAAFIDNQSPDPGLQDKLVRHFVWRVTDQLYFDDPYDAVDAQEDDHFDNVLREIRSDLRKGDIEHVELLIHYELGDY